MLTLDRCLLAVTPQSSRSFPHDSHIDEASLEPQKVTKERTDDDAGSRKGEEVFIKNTTQPPDAEAEHEQLGEHTVQERRLGDDRDNAKGTWGYIVFNYNVNPLILGG